MHLIDTFIQINLHEEYFLVPLGLEPTTFYMIFATM